MPRHIRRILAAGAAIALLGGLAGPVLAGPEGPQPVKPVDLGRYLGVWYELGRYENMFERGCEAVTAEYRPRPDKQIQVINTCHKGRVDGPASRAAGSARVVAGSGDAKLKVTFFWPFSGDYWVLDHADDYSWSIVGEPSRKFLWLLSRTPNPPAATRDLLTARVRAFGYDPDRIRPTKQ
jgi:apolipoprotein D and lipocalin family protein